jgi:membrane protease YdiL (CAAX protease family)
MDTTVVAGLAVAGAAMGSMFAFGRWHFWGRAAVAGAVIGAVGAVAARDHLDDLLRPTAVDIAAGSASAVLLYLVFRVGDRVLARRTPALAREVDDLYRLRDEAGPAAILTMIATVAVCEELFWRGFVQARSGLVVATAGYALVLVWERKVVLIAAALICGATWGALFAWRDTLVAPMVSHVLWDAAIMVFVPVRRARTAQASTAPTRP